MKKGILFVAGSVLLSACLLRAAVPDGEAVTLRGSLGNARAIFAATGRGTVAFLGGSITEREGYRPLLCQALHNRFPKTSFTFIPAGISSTCSSTGAFRFNEDVLSKGKVDLLFVEFAVNDDQDGHFTAERCVRGMEGIVRQARLANPKMDIVMTFFVNEYILSEVQAGRTPRTIAEHGKVAERYGLPTVNVALALAQKIRDGKMTWQIYGGVHPAAPGNQLAADLLDELLARANALPLPDAAVPYVLPAPIDAQSYFRGRFVRPAVPKTAGWTFGVPPWSTLKGSIRANFAKKPLYVATAPAEWPLAFTGTCIGIYMLSGPDAGTVETSIDGAPFVRLSLAQPYGIDLHYPCTTFFADGLAAGPHKLLLRVPSIPENQGKAVRFLAFAEN